MRAFLNQITPSTDSFVFHTLRNPKLKDALVIHNPPHVVCEAPVLMRSSKTLEDHISYIAEKNINKAIIVAEDIGFLRQCPSLEYLWILPAISAVSLDYSPLYDLPSIRWLRCEIPNGKSDESPLDCSRMHNLNCLSISGWNSNLNVYETTKLKSLYLDSGLPYDRNLSILQPKCAVQNMVVENSSIVSLSGIKNVQQLKRLELGYNRRLQNIDELLDIRKSLIWLDIDNCNAITDFSVLSDLHNLELLRLSGTKGIPSLNFVKKMPNLKCLIVMMDVFDGNMSCCTDIPYVAIKNRKHFSHKDKDFTKKVSFPFSITAYE